ncbi:uncharacterized protein [Triticum aestivum]|uniref:uncharacterized protein isoform X2 n=1 Tax=Triticum aestivum TaxID=4565 RepID=UPI001D01BEC8|nr:uncharacterized protein LOC123098755 isoform X2 [Triticum aestivum]
MGPRWAAARARSQVRTLRRPNQPTVAGDENASGEFDADCGKVIAFDAMVAGRGLQPGRHRMTVYDVEDFRLLAALDSDLISNGGHMMYGRAKIRPDGARDAAGNLAAMDMPSATEAVPDPGAGPREKIVLLSSVPGWQAEVVEYLSTVMHAHMSSVCEENMNLRNHLESCMTSVLAMIDSRNDSNVNSVNEMLGCAISKVGDFRQKVVGGEVCFLNTNEAHLGVPHDVKGKANVPETTLQHK